MISAKLADSTSTEPGCISMDADIIPNPLNIKSATPDARATTLSSSPQAVRPDTPATVDARALRRSSTSIVSRSADYCSLDITHLPCLRPEKNVTARSLPFKLALADLSLASQLDARALCGPGLLPQPPLSGSRAPIITSPRMRSFSSRSLSPVSHFHFHPPTTATPEETAASSSAEQELRLSQSPRRRPSSRQLLLDPPETPGEPVALETPYLADIERRGGLPPPSQTGVVSMSATQSSPSQPPGVPPTPIQASPTNDASATSSGFRGTSAPGCASEDAKCTDPWAELRAHCMLAYGGNLSSDGDDSDGYGYIQGSSPGSFYTGPAPSGVVLVRHPSLARQGSSRQLVLGGVAAGNSSSPTGVAAVPPVAASSARRLSLGDRDAASVVAAVSAFTTPTVAVLRTSPRPAGQLPRTPFTPTSTSRSGAAASLAEHTATTVAVAEAAGVGMEAPARSAPAMAAALSEPHGSSARVPKAGADVAVTELPPARLTSTPTPPTAADATTAAATAAVASPILQQPQLQPSLSLRSAGSVQGREPIPPGLSGPPISSIRTGATHSGVSAAIADNAPPAPAGVGRVEEVRATTLSSSEAAKGYMESPYVPTATLTATVAVLPSPTQRPQQLTPSQTSAAKPPIQRQLAVRGASGIGGAASLTGAGLPSAASTTAERPTIGSVSSGSALTSVEVLLPQNLAPLMPLHGGGGGAPGSVVDSVLGFRVSDSGSQIAVVGSILDVAQLYTDPLRKRRISADGLNRHASKYGVVVRGTVSGSGDSAGESLKGSAVERFSEPHPTQDTTTTITTGAASTPTSGLPSPSLSPMPSGAGSRSPLINALTFEKAPWSQCSTGAAAAAPAAGSPGAIRQQTPGASLYGPSFGARGARPVWPVLSPSSSASTPRVNGLTLGPHTPPVSWPQQSSTQFGDDLASTASNTTAVDKLRGFKSSKVLMTSFSSTVMTTTLATPPSNGGVAVAALVDNQSLGVNSSAMNSTGPSRRASLGPFASMRSFCPPATTASTFLERLSGSSGLVGSRGGGRRTVCGGAAIAAMGEWAVDGGRRSTFRRREGSQSLDGSGNDAVPRSDGRSGTAAESRGEAGAGVGVPGRRHGRQLLPKGVNGLPLAWSAIEEDAGEGSDRGRDEKVEGTCASGGVGLGDDGGGGEGEDQASAVSPHERGISVREAGPGRSGVEGKNGAGEQQQRDDENDDGFGVVARQGGWTDMYQSC